MAKYNRLPANETTLSYRSETTKAGKKGRICAICFGDVFLEWAQGYGFIDGGYDIGFQQRNGRRCVIIKKGGDISISKSGNNGKYAQIRKRYHKDLPNKLKTFGETSPDKLYYDPYYDCIVLVLPKILPPVRKNGKYPDDFEEAIIDQNFYVKQSPAPPQDDIAERLGQATKELESVLAMAETTKARIDELQQLKHLMDKHGIVR